MGELERAGIGVATPDAGHGVVKMSPTGEITEINEAAAHIFGIRRDAAIGSSARGLVPERLRAFADAELALMQTGARPQSVGETLSLAIVRGDATEVPVSITVTPQNGSVKSGIVAFITPISPPATDTVSIVEGAPDLGGVGTFDWDIGGKGRSYSDELLRIYGLPPGEEPTFEEFLEMVHPHDRPRVQQLRDELKAAAPERVIIDLRVARPDGSVRFVVVYASATLDDDGEVTRVVATVLDTTELRGATQSLAARDAVDSALLAWDNADGGLAGLLRRLTLALDWGGGQVWVPGLTGDVLVRRAQWNRPDEMPLRRDTPRPSSLRHGQGLAGRAWAAREARTTNEAIAVPIECAGQFLGVLEFNVRAGGGLPKKLCDTLALVSQTQLSEFLLRHRPALGMSPLTERELEVLQMATDGGSSATIAERLVISPSTVKTHFEHIYQKLGVADRGGAVAQGFRHGLVT